MPASRSFQGITPESWLRIKASSKKQHGTVYADDDSGTAVTTTPVGPIVIQYRYDLAQQRIDYTIVNKPFLIGEAMIWNGIEETIAGCRSDKPQD